jgi:hypothetical protein
MLLPALPPSNRSNTTPQQDEHPRDHNQLAAALDLITAGPHLVQSYADRAAMLGDDAAPLGTVGRYGTGVNTVVAVKTATAPVVWQPITTPYRAWAPRFRRADDGSVVGGAGIAAAGWELNVGALLTGWGQWSTTSSVGNVATAQLELDLPFPSRGLAVGTPLGTFAAVAAGWGNVWRTGVIVSQTTGTARLRGAGVAGFVTLADVTGTGTNFVLNLSYPAQTAQLWL